MNPDVTTILSPLRANAEKHPDKLLYAFLDVDGRTKQSYRYDAFLQRTSANSVFHRAPPSPNPTTPLGVCSWRALTRSMIRVKKPAQQQSVADQESSSYVR